MKIQLRCTTIGIGKVGGTATYAGFQTEDVTEGIYLDAESGAPLGVLVSGLKPSVPRAIKTTNALSSTYRAALVNWLRKNGISNPRVVSPRLVSVDLDGNGSDEVLIEARSRNTLLEGGMESGKPGDYSVVLVRSLVRGRVETKALQYDRYSAESNLLYDNRIVAVADLDGDRKMEVVVSSDYYEGQSAAIWRLRSGVPIRIVEHGAGL